MQWLWGLLMPPAAASAVGATAGWAAHNELGFALMPAIALAASSALIAFLVAIQVWTPHEDGRDG